jgi:coenzyme F420-reducing hydrogenase beta subunit
VLYSGDERIRYQASSGGVVSSVIKHLFEKGEIQNAISYEFDKYVLFKPKLIDSYEDYQIVGSIYHEVKLIEFVKDNTADIKGKMLVVCLPCQIKGIKKLLEQSKIDYIIVALTCSAQMSKEATWFLLRKFKIKREDIEFFRYRGNGWPSGVQLKTASNEYFFDNTKSIWKEIFHSHLFTLKRCLSCTDTFGLEADISVADPWLEKYMATEDAGVTLVLRHTKTGDELIQETLRSGALKLKESISPELAIKSQQKTLNKKYIFRKYKTLLNPVLKVMRSKVYISFVSLFCLIKIHTRVFNMVISILLKLEKVK